MQGYETHLIFVGDPAKPARETLVDGKLHLERWGQWISKYYPNGVYDGEEQKLYDYSQSVPPYICEQIVRPAVEEGKIVVIIGEDWHTAETICRTSDLLLRAQSASPRRLDVELQQPDVTAPHQLGAAQLRLHDHHRQPLHETPALAVQRQPARDPQWHPSSATSLHLKRA